jgi:hypothetical protein
MSSARALEVVVEPPVVRGARVIRAAAVKPPGGLFGALWYSLPAACASATTDSADPFVIACVLLAMRRNRPLRVRGTVSPSLLANLERYQQRVASWWPELYRPVALTADRLEEQPPAASGPVAVAAFSGGLDSCYTLFRHVRRLGPAPFLDVRGTVLAQGFDIPLRDPGGFRRAVERMRATSESLGVPLFDVATNFRDLPLVWEHAHGPALASVLAQFSRGHNHGLIASSHQVAPLSPLGSHVETDPLLSSASFRIVHDSALMLKLEKIAVIRDWPAALQGLRTCWQGRDRAANCGRCEKCLRTILLFRAQGLFPPCFPRDVTDDDIRRARIRDANVHGTYLGLLDHLHARGIRAPWVTALEETVARHMQRPWRPFADRLPRSVHLALLETQSAWRRLVRRDPTGRG